MASAAGRGSRTRGLAALVLALVVAAAGLAVHRWLEENRARQIEVILRGAAKQAELRVEESLHERRWPGGESTLAREPGPASADATRVWLGSLMSSTGGGALVMRQGRTLAHVGPRSQVLQLADVLERRGQDGAKASLHVVPERHFSVAIVKVVPDIVVGLWASDLPALLKAERDHGMRSDALHMAVVVLLALLTMVGLWGRRRAPTTERESTPRECTRRESQERDGGESAAQVGPESATLLARPRPAAPVKLGRYTLLGPLGEGGTAEIYSAACFGSEGFRRPFVVKRLRPELARDRDLVDHFVDEAKIGAKLAHPNILTVLDFGRDGDEFFLVTDYLFGRTVSQICARLAGPMPLSLVVRFAKDVLGALGYAHERADEAGEPLHLVHRDVSPNNVMLTVGGETKLLDFGIAKVARRTSSITQHGVVKGNLFFMSPEQARGHALNARSDLFSLGLVICYAMTGKCLYEGATQYDLLLRAAAGPANLGATLAPFADVEPRLCAILTRALAVDPDRRFQSAAEMLAAFAGLADSSCDEHARFMKALCGDDLQKEEAFLGSAMAAMTRWDAA
jgi:tRNA A-37 threonylcarbamoyl transferase component Bud32